MKELKGYIHLYIGCNVFDENNDIWVLAGFTESEVEPGKYIAICKLKPPYHKQVFGELYTDQVKLILRPLESITKEEIREVIQYDKLKDEYKTIEYSFDGILKTIFVDYSVESEDGGVFHNSWELCLLNCHADDFRWVLSKGFDIFGLKEAGLAVYENDKA